MKSEQSILGLALLVIVAIFAGWLFANMHVANQGEIFICDDSTVEVRDGVAVYIDCHVWRNNELAEHAIQVYVREIK